jgi:hypothetical protein
MKIEKGKGGAESGKGEIVPPYSAHWDVTKVAKAKQFATYYSQWSPDHVLSKTKQTDFYEVYRLWRTNLKALGGWNIRTLLEPYWTDEWFFSLGTGKKPNALEIVHGDALFGVTYQLASIVGGDKWVNSPGDLWAKYLLEPGLCEKFATNPPSRLGGLVERIIREAHTYSDAVKQDFLRRGARANIEVINRRWEERRAEWLKKNCEQAGGNVVSLFAGKG